MVRARSRAVCDGLRAALRAYGVPQQILTDNGKVFTGRFHHPPVEVFFDAICRQNGIEHLLTQPRSPTTTGKIERFHRSLRAEFLSKKPAFTNLKAAQPNPESPWRNALYTAGPRPGRFRPRRSAARPALVRAVGSVDAR